MSHGWLIDRWYNTDTENWTILTPNQIPLPAAARTDGATRLAGLIAPHIMTSSTDPACGTTAETHIASNHSPEGTITPASFELHMPLGGIGEAAFGFSTLTGLIDSTFVSLSSAQVSCEAEPTPSGG